MSTVRSLPVLAATALIAVVTIALVVARPAANLLAVDHVYAAAGTAGLRVIDVTNPTAPKEVGTAGALAATVALAVTGDYAYAAEGGSGMLVIDVSDPTSPLRVGTFTGGADGVAVEGDYAYVVDPTGLRVVDVSDRTVPTEVGFLRGGASAVAAAGDYAYVAALFGLQVIDVSDPTSPSLAGMLVGRAVDVAVAGNRAYLADRLQGLRVVDVSDPAAPSQMSTLPLNGEPQAVAVLGSQAYVGTTTSPTGSGGALYIVDVSNGAAPSPLGAFPADVVDVAVSDSTAYLATANGALVVVDVSNPAQPSGVSAFVDPAYDVLRVALDSQDITQPTATPTSGPPTVTPTVTATATPTRTSRPSTQTPTPSASPTPFAKPTRDPSKRWLSLDSSNSILPFNRARFVAVDRQGTVWLRVRNPRGGPDAVIAARSKDTWRRFASLKDAALRNLATVRDQGFLEDFWAVDRRGRIWIGPEYFDGIRWKTVATDDRHVGGTVRHSRQVVLDADDRAWVPFSTSSECPNPDLCRAEGLRSYGTSGNLGLDVFFEPAPEAGRYGVPEFFLTAAPTGQAWAVSRRALYVLPIRNPVRYPFLGSLFEQPAGRNAGYATAATLRPDGRLQVFSWVEQHTRDRFGRRILDYRVFGNTWNGDDWLEPEDLTHAPMFVGGVAFDRIVTASYAPNGQLWVATSSGKVGVRDASGAWVDLFGPTDSPLAAGQVINDLALGPDGTVWVATDDGLMVYGNVDTPAAAWVIFLPSAEQP